MGEDRLNMDTVDRSGTHSLKWEERERRFGSKDILPLWVADMDLASPSCVRDALIARAKHPIYGYTVYPDTYYGAISGWMTDRFGWDIQKEWIVPANGVVSSINLTVEALTNIGDGIIVQTPIYPPFIHAVQKQGRRLLENRLLYRDGRYSIDFEDFESKAKEAKLFLFCSPHNPTTRVWDLAELERLAALCRKYDILIVSDEIHADIIYQKHHNIMASLAPERTLHLGAPSKSFNIAGLQSSFVIIEDKKLRLAYEKRQRSAGLGEANPFGIEALIAAYSGGKPWLEALKAELKKNIDLVNRYLSDNSIPIVAVETEATFLVWLDCQGLGYDDQALEEFFSQEAKLGLNAGRSFGEAGSGFMRINVGTSQEVLQEAMQRLHCAWEKRFAED